jgi:hypothetical protein
MSSFRSALASLLSQTFYVDLFLLSVYGLTCFATDRLPQPPETMLVVALILVHWVQWVAMTMAWQTVARGQDTGQEAPKAEEPMVDPWLLQRALMAASKQPLPVEPVLNNTGVLYSALIMEELAETCSGLASVLGRFTPKDGHNFEVKTVEAILMSIGHDLASASNQIRSLLPSITIYSRLDQKEAVELLDGITDIAVVTAGFALATGLPGGEAYLEVACSNLSKANPATGLIDKDAGGKWIKGPEYQRPDLARVLTHFYEYDRG